jgi:hypothetical protein
LIELRGRALKDVLPLSMYVNLSNYGNLVNIKEALSPMSKTGQQGVFASALFPYAYGLRPGMAWRLIAPGPLPAKRDFGGLEGEG